MNGVQIGQRRRFLASVEAREFHVSCVSTGIEKSDTPHISLREQVRFRKIGDGDPGLSGLRMGIGNSGAYVSSVALD